MDASARNSVKLPDMSPPSRSEWMMRTVGRGSGLPLSSMGVATVALNAARMSIIALTTSDLRLMNSTKT